MSSTVLIASDRFFGCGQKFHEKFCVAAKNLPQDGRFLDVSVGAFGKFTFATKGKFFYP